MAKVFDHIDWNLQIRAKEKREAEAILKNFGTAAGATIRTISLEIGWKSDSLFEAKLIAPFNVEEPSQAIFRLLLMMREVATGWQIKGPIDYEDGLWLFGGLAAVPQARFLVAGIEWANVEMRNFPMVRK